LNRSKDVTINLDTSKNLSHTINSDLYLKIDNTDISNISESYLEKSNLESISNLQEIYKHNNLKNIVNNNKEEIEANKIILKTNSEIHLNSKNNDLNLVDSDQNRLNIYNQKYDLNNRNKTITKSKKIKNRKRNKFIKGEIDYKRNHPCSFENQIHKNCYYSHKLSTSKEIDISFIGKNEIINKPKKMTISIQKRSYTYPCKNSLIFDCQKITITESYNFDDLVPFVKPIIKIIIISCLCIVLWFYIAIFIQSIYKNYGKNIFKICAMPLITLLIINLVFVSNIKILIATILLYFKGKEYINRAKHNIFIKIIFKIFVQEIALNHFNAIMTYQTLLKK